MIHHNDTNSKLCDGFTVAKITIYALGVNRTIFCQHYDRLKAAFGISLSDHASGAPDQLTASIGDSGCSNHNIFTTNDVFFTRNSMQDVTYGGTELSNYKMAFVQMVQEFFISEFL